MKSNDTSIRVSRETREKLEELRSGAKKRVSLDELIMTMAEHYAGQKAYVAATIPKKTPR